MSYILDALRRADSERERGAVPGVHAQVPLPGLADDELAPPMRLWPIASVVLALVLLAVLGWQFVGGAAPLSSAPAPAPLPVPLPVADAVRVPKPVEVLSEAPASAPPAVAAAPVVAPKPVVRPAPVVARLVPPTSAATAPRAAASVAPDKGAAPPPPPARIPMASELPDDVRAGLPTFAIGGATYSQNAESRMLIVNGQVFREGDKLSPDVTLEKIRLKEAVLSARGVRYRIAY